MSEEAALLDSIIDEFLHSYPRGTRMIAVASRDRMRSSAFATALADAFSARGVVARSETPDAADAETLRTGLVAPFRSAREEAVLLVAGDEGLLDGGRRGMWHFSVWLMADGEPPHTAAGALVDVTDPQHPARRFADYCAVPDDYRS